MSSVADSAAVNTDVDTVIPPSTEVVAQQVRDLESRFTRRLHHLNEIGLALSAIRDLDALLDLILQKARELTGCDAGSLFMIETEGTREKDDDTLYFRTSFNDSVTLPTAEKFAISPGSLAGYAALSGEQLCIEDVYHLPPGLPYRFNSSLDQKIGYRTKSVLVMPMKTHAGDMIGVLQLINPKRDRDAKLADEATVLAEVLPFDDDARQVAASLASQAAIAIENNLQQKEILKLLADIELLFESFVTATTKTIDDRDPCTSGHSFRVTSLTLALAREVNEATEGPFKDIHFSPQQMKELRYAGLLHDVGKIGVRENVLTKSHKLEPTRFEVVRLRLALVRQARINEYAEARLKIAVEAADKLETKLAQAAAEHAAAMAEIDEISQMLTTANDPAVTFLPDDDYARQQDLLKRLAELHYTDEFGVEQPVVTEDEIKALSIRKGSLTPEEYKQIQRHAQLSYDFLKKIRWTSEFAEVPYIAACHHEKLNGKGYPDGRTADQIPFQSRMMTVADIYDALTAADRPYKKALPVDMAMNILQWEADQGGLDPDLIALFKEKKVYEHSDDIKPTNGN